MEIALSAEVHCTDGMVGHCVAIIIMPATNQVTHVVVKGQGALLGQYLVPLTAVAKGASHQLDLSWTQAEVGAATRFDQALFVDDSGLGPGGATAWSSTGGDELAFGTVPPVAFMQVEQVPEAELPVHTGAHVDASDGRVGRVDAFQVDDATGAITHLVLRRGHLWGKREIAVPASAIDHIADDIVYLKLDKAALEELPSAAVRK